jgi:predicted deacylase
MKIAGVSVKRGETKQIKLAIAKLTSGIAIDVPVMVTRGHKDGPVLLLMAGLHGDEINSVDVIRTIIEQKLNHVDSGTVICVPILNVFGFINFSREVPDGKDVNRSFPGHSKGSLASQIAYHFNKLILPHCDYIIDFHTGGKSRYNIPQVRTVLDNKHCKELANVFNAPFTLHSNLIPKTLRETASKQDKIIIVFEGGEALRFDEHSLDVAITGTKNVLNYLKMKPFKQSKTNSITKHQRKWMRAPDSGFFHPTVNVGDHVKDGQIVGTISGPFVDYKEECVATKTGYVVTLNNNPMVNRGDAILQVAYESV